MVYTNIIINNITKARKVQTIQNKINMQNKKKTTQKKKAVTALRITPLFYCLCICFLQWFLKIHIKKNFQKEKRKQNIIYVSIIYSKYTVQYIMHTLLSLLTLSLLSIFDNELEALELEEPFELEEELQSLVSYTL